MSEIAQIIIASGCGLSFLLVAVAVLIDMVRKTRG